MQHRESALVTGSTSGIGLAIANELAARGMNIMLNGFGDPVEVEGVRRRIAETHGVDVAYDGADMSSAAAIEAMMKAASERFGGIDVLVNNAGIQHVAPGVTAHEVQQLGAHCEYRICPRAGGQSIQVGLRRGQTRHGGIDQDRSA